MDDLVGTSLRGYHIEERIGSGGYGIVYRASQPSIDREVAVKVILPARAKTEYFINRFDAEAHLVAKLEHPHIVPLYDYWREEDSAALVMRWLPGGDFCSVLEKGPLSIERILKMLDQIGDALTLAHKHNIVHRDLKPGNVLLDDEGNFYLTDFGIAKDLKGIITADSTTGHVTGTPAYLSPEQGMGKKVTHQSDIYSLGVLLYELLTGEHPFPEADPTTQIIHHISDPLPAVSTIREHLPVALDNVIEIATAKEPQQRYDSIQQLISAFREASGHTRDERAPSTPGILEKKLGIKPYVPAFLNQAEITSDTPRDIFVGRERHLAKLDQFLQKALSGKTQIVFVTGEAGRGKTALIQEFARRAESTSKNLIVAQGGSSLYTGVADPYLPFRQALAMLTGDVESQLTSGEISFTQAQRLWKLLPDMCKSLVDTSPDLVDTFLSARELAARAAGFDAKGRPWQSQLAALLARKAEEGFTAESGQSQLYRQYIQLLKRTSKDCPIIILLDDLHWIDQASLGLLVTISHEMKASPIMLVGAYRDEEIRDHEDAPHPLVSILSEFKRQFGDVWIDLDKSERAEDRSFVDEYLDSEPNKLSKKFRQALSRHTHGHALFLKELLRDLQERGELIKDDRDRWVEKRKDITWDYLPARVEGVIEKRIERLDRDACRVLEVASVEGERFSAEVVASVLDRDTAELIDHLITDLARRHQLVEDLGVERLNGNSVSRFRFTHGLLRS
ncbi:MAG: protein kinase, partial [Anaerolineae bacterium]|nr:protein kinase [Anaerolineae bacterium]